MLWPKLEDQTAAHFLAASGGVGDAAFDAFDVAHFALAFLRDRYPEILERRYKIAPAGREPHELLKDVARGRGLLQRGGVLDIDRAAELLLRELRSGKLGRISFETPEDVDARAAAAAESSSSST